VGDRVEIRREDGRLVVRRGPVGMLGLGGVGMASAALWIWGIARAVDPIVKTFFAFMLLGSLSFLTIGLIVGSAWRVEAGPETVSFVREGPFGERRRSWPAWDVTSFWTTHSAGEETGETWWLWVGFGNGRHELILQEAFDLQGVVDLLKRDRPRSARPRPPEGPPRFEAAEGRCPVCGEGMSSRVVACARCRTPHHAECWTYVGMCSTYGCREIQVLTF
jgi:hypothetical protein